MLQGSWRPSEIDVAIKSNPSASSEKTSNERKNHDRTDQ